MRIFDAIARKTALGIIGLSLFSVTTGLGAERDTLKVISMNAQKAFPKTVPAGNYSGIAYLGNNEYIVVDDKSKTDGFHLFTIDIDSVSGEIIQVINHGFNTSGQPNRDGEGIAYLPFSGTVLMSGEADGAIKEYTIEGEVTGREVQIPHVFSNAAANLGFEALSYSAVKHRLWACNESTLVGDGERADAQNGVRNRLRIQSFDDSLQAQEQYAYLMDAPVSTAAAATYAMGVPTITALDDGSLLVLEREFFVSPIKVGSFVNCKLFQAWADKPIAGDAEMPRDEVPFMDKCLLAEWKTSLGLVKRTTANYEGMCLGPRLADGSHVLVLVSDSQNQHGGVLKDWFKTIVLR